MRQRMPERCHPHLVVEKVGDEALVYDPATLKGHRLSPVAAFVLDHCGRKKTIRQVGQEVELKFGVAGGGDVVRLTLARLREKALIMEPPAGEVLTRRALISKWGKIAAVLPVVTTVLAPTPASAASCVMTACNGGNLGMQCCGVNCVACPGGCGGTCMCFQMHQTPAGNGGSCITDTASVIDCNFFNPGTHFQPDCAAARAYAVANFGSGPVNYFCSTNCT